ncbi:related to amidohydrolase [Melanopsichium pennsylvanicum]|uniref:Related to amidohydrolase n=2 Tax=Melanopsichium pennsylvanicum TaxID=63383 RepID=A0AAJ4XHT1_9BASI|nr:related to amidohydrolase [Melanopsichium pennsylvanicum 4]SNX82839.1 related to amidohydrolase [Melanopsichium pennsylvanicum]
MVGCFSFLKPVGGKSVKMTPNVNSCSCNCKCSSHLKFSQQQVAVSSNATNAEKTPLSASVYYDACNPPPFSAGDHQQCCGGITAQGLVHSHLPTYRDSEQHSHHSVRYTQGNADSKLSDVMHDVAKSIENEIEKLDKELRELSIDMHDHPEIMWEERRTHDLFVKYFSGKKGWKVTPHAYDQETAFEVIFKHKANDESRIIGFQSELDALPGIGHACGHNLIAISGVAAALSVAATLVAKDIAGTVVLLGTPAEEGGGGKIRLEKAGAYKNMDACLMVHPASVSGTGPMLAVQPVIVTYKGRTAHSGASPWEGINALDAAVLAYNNVSALRQQIQPSERVHGIIKGNNWAPNVVPGESTLIYNVRAPTVSALKALVGRVQKCFEAAALATGCTGEYDWQTAYADVHNTPLLSAMYSQFLDQKFGLCVPDDGFAASTDFGNITYALPSLHAEYKIHLDDPRTQGNHTVGFADAAKTQEAHDRTKEAALGIAVVGARVLVEKEYRDQIWDEWREWRKSSDGP